MDFSRPSTSHGQSSQHMYISGATPPLPTASSLHSANSSLSSRASSTDLQSGYQFPKSISPAFDEDGSSVRSTKRWRGIRSIFTRRSSSDATETLSQCSSTASSPTHSIHNQARRPSLPRFASFSTLPPRKQSFGEGSIKTSPLSIESPSQELKCHRCYYFAARNCNGWTMGGSHGDACEQCLVGHPLIAASPYIMAQHQLTLHSQQAGFFGAP